MFLVWVLAVHLLLVGDHRIVPKQMNVVSTYIRSFSLYFLLFEGFLLYYKLTIVSFQVKWSTIQNYQTTMRHLLRAFAEMTLSGIGQSHGGQKQTSEYLQFIL